MKMVVIVAFNSVESKLLCYYIDLSACDQSNSKHYNINFIVDDLHIMVSRLFLNYQTFDKY